MGRPGCILMRYGVFGVQCVARLLRWGPHSDPICIGVDLHCCALCLRARPCVPGVPVTKCFMLVVHSQATMVLQHFRTVCRLLSRHSCHLCCTLMFVVPCSPSPVAFVLMSSSIAGVRGYVSPVPAKPFRQMSFHQILGSFVSFLFCFFVNLSNSVFHCA